MKSGFSRQRWGDCAGGDGGDGGGGEVVTESGGEDVTERGGEGGVGDGDGNGGWDEGRSQGNRRPGQRSLGAGFGPRALTNLLMIGADIFLKQEC